MRRARAEDHRFGEPALLFKPIVRLFGQLGDGVTGEKLGRQSAVVRLVCDSLRAVFAEVERRTLAIGFRPGTSGAINAALLVDFKQRQCAAHESGLTPGKLKARNNGFHSSGLALRLSLVKAN